MAYNNTYFSSNAPTNYAALKTAMEAYETEVGISGKDSRKSKGLACEAALITTTCVTEAAQTIEDQ